MDQDQPARVLIIEDDAGVARLQQKKLERAGHQAIVVLSTSKARAEIARQSFDVILIDYRLTGECNGLEFYRVLKSEGYHLPAILITGFANESLVVQALRDGVRDFVSKSADYLDYLPNTVEQVVRRARTEQKLTESEALHRITLGSVSDAVLITGDDGRLVYTSPQPDNCFGYTADEIYGLGNVACVLGSLLCDSEDLDRHGEISNIDHTVTDKHGRRRHLLINIKRVSIRGGTRLYTCHDITNRRKLEEQLRQAQKMEAIGRLAGGIAHDFNNLLTVIIGNTEMALETSGDAELAPLLRDVSEAAQRAASLTRQLLAFSRLQMLEPRIVDINELLDKTQRLLARMIGEDIKIVTRLAADLERVKVDPSQVEQILFNLAVNARDAMPQGGQLVITTENVVLDEAEAAAADDVTPGRYVRIAFADTGTGMTSDVQQRIFEPFFTTKEVGRGTGMGLATVFGIVKQSGGHICVESEVGRGTNFKVYLPVSSPSAQPSFLHESPSADLRGSETVLLVEDEPSLRKLTRRMLEENGYRVLDAENGDRALKLSQECSDPIDLLFADVVMPGMSGRELAERLRAQRPQLKVLYMSGYTDDAVLRHGGTDASPAFLQKPFTRVTLARTLRSLLAKY